MKAYKLIAIIALGGLMACGPIARAQSTNAPATPGENTPHTPRTGRRGPNMQAIFDKLDLTDDQKAKLKPVMDDMRDKMSALREDSSLSREDRMTKARDIREATDTKIKGILTPEQYTKFVDLRKQAMNGRRGGAGGAGGNTTPPSGNQ